MNRVIIYFLLLWMGTIPITNAQQAIVGAGGEASGSGGSASYSVGQPFYTTKGSTTTTADGVQQAYDFYLNMDQVAGNNIAMQMYPNPTVRDVQLVVETIEDLEWRLFDVNGKLITQNSITATTSTIPMNNLVTGTYLLQVVRENQLVQSFKIIKNN